MGIGVAAVLIVTALGEGARRYVQQQFSGLGANLVIVFPGRSETAGGAAGFLVGKTPRDLLGEKTPANMETYNQLLQVAARPGVSGRDDWPLPRILETFPRLAERLNHGGQQLSGGEQQMLAIGRALSTNPDLLILDEATEGLAPIIVREIWRIIGAIRETGIASLIVDRNFRTVLANTDRAIILEKGRVVLEGRSEAMASAPQELAARLGV